MNENGGFFSGDWLGAFLIIAVMFGGFGGFGFGGAAAANAANAATQAEVQGMINAQTNQATLENIMLSSANNNYEALKTVNDQTMFLSNQQNTNLINAIQGFNAVNTGMVNGFNTVNQGLCNSTNSINQNLFNGFAAINQNLADLGYRMDKCCCEIKTQMLQDRLSDTQAALTNAQDIANNSAQSAYILSQIGKFTLNSTAAATA